jgi:hypothetical protein
MCQDIWLDIWLDPQLLTESPPQVTLASPLWRARWALLLLACTYSGKGAASPGRCRHSHTPLYISCVVLHT